MIMVDVGVYLEHLQVIRSDIGPESVEKCRDVRNEPIWANFRKKVKGIPLGPFFKTSLYFHNTDCSIFKTLYKDCELILLKGISVYFFAYFNNYKMLEL
jgi:hypothetical protein